MSDAKGERQPNVSGVEERDKSDDEIRDPDDQDQPDEGPAMGAAGAGPGGNAMDHWETAMPSPDATKPESMPNTESQPLPGETADRDPV